jgi:hypothetical protein
MGTLKTPALCFRNCKKIPRPNLACFDAPVTFAGLPKVHCPGAAPKHQVVFRAGPLAYRRKTRRRNLRETNSYRHYLIDAESNSRRSSSPTRYSPRRSSNRNDHDPKVEAQTDGGRGRRASKLAGARQSHKLCVTPSQNTREANHHPTEENVTEGPTTPLQYFPSSPGQLDLKFR